MPEPTSPATPEPCDPDVPPPGLDGDFALSLSGGGYRAAAYHLGVLDVLERVGLLSRLTTLSTISGGTIAGASLLASRVRGEAFDTFFVRLYDALRDRNVIAEALEGVDDRHSDANGKLASRSLSRAAAAVYRDVAFAGDVTLAEVAGLSGPIEVVIGSTEFFSGRRFRFQTSQRSDVESGAEGNPEIGDLRIPDEVAEQIGLADAVGASACFPGGLEPLRFPDDFAWTQGTPLGAIREALPWKKPIPLVDGGAIDNQGIDGVKLVYERKPEAVPLVKGLGLLLISDTSRDIPPMMKMPARRRRKGVRLRHVLGASIVGWLAALGMVLLAAGVLARSAWGALASDPVGWGDAVVVAVPLLLSVLAAVCLVGLGVVAFWGMRSLDRWLGFSVQSGLGELPVLALWDGVRHRVQVLEALVSKVSMKRVRRMTQDGIWGDAAYRGRLADALIYDLAEADGLRVDGKTVAGTIPSEALRGVSRRSTDIGTVLWLHDVSALRDLVACGQATACYSLMEFLLGVRGVSTPSADPEEHAMYKRVEALWRIVNEGDPYGLIARPNSPTT